MAGSEASLPRVSSYQPLSHSVAEDRPPVPRLMPDTAGPRDQPPWNPRQDAPDPTCGVSAQVTAVADRARPPAPDVGRPEGPRPCRQWIRRRGAVVCFSCLRVHGSIIPSPWYEARQWRAPDVGSPFPPLTSDTLFSQAEPKPARLDLAGNLGCHRIPPPLGFTIANRVCRNPVCYGIWAGHVSFSVPWR